MLIDASGLPTNDGGDVEAIEVIDTGDRLSIVQWCDAWGRMERMDVNMSREQFEAVMAYCDRVRGRAEPRAA